MAEQLETKKTKKILFVISWLIRRAGTEKNLSDLVTNLDRAEWTPYIWAFRGGALCEELMSKGVNVQVKESNKILSLKCLKRGLELIKFIKKEKIDIIVTYHTDADIFGSIFGKIAGVPVVISNRRDMGFCLSTKQIWFYRAFSFLFNCFIAVSESVKNSMIKREWVRMDKIEVIYNGVGVISPPNPKDLIGVRERFKIDKNKMVIGCIGRFEPIKGQLFVVDALRKLIMTYPNLVCLFVGYTDTDYFESVKKKIDYLNLNNHFIFAGHQEDIYPFLNCMDIFVSPSLSEGFSNAILESMAVGIPVIASDVGGNREAIEHEKSGLLFKSGDSTSLAIQLERLITDQKLRGKVAVEGRKRVEEFFGLEEMIRKYEELFRYSMIKPRFTDRIRFNSRCLLFIV